MSLKDRVKSSLLGPLNMTLLGKRVSADKIKTRLYWSKGGLNTMTCNPSTIYNHKYHSHPWSRIISPMEWGQALLCKPQHQKTHGVYALPCGSALHLSSLVLSVFLVPMAPGRAGGPEAHWSRAETHKAPSYEGLGVKISPGSEDHLAPLLISHYTFSP